MDEVTFTRYLHEIADQLGPTDVQKLPKILQTRLGSLYSTVSPPSQLLTSFESLFKYLTDQQLISYTDISLLQYILEDLNKTDLLYPFYESQIANLQHSTAKKSTCSEFLLLLLQIGRHLSHEDVRTLAYLLQDLISRYKAATLHDGVEILDIVKQRHYISSTHPCFLLTLLKDINREDLCCMVEQYKMANSLPGLEYYSNDDKPCCSFFLNFKKKSWSRREYRFRLAMKKMSDVLNPRDLDNMKLLSQSRLPHAMIDKVDSVLELFWLLEDHGHLSIDDLYFLEELLEDKSYLIDSIYCQLSSSSQPSSRENSLTRKIKNKVTRAIKPEDSQAKCFSKMLKLIGNGLTQKETKHLKVLSESCSSEKIKTGVELVSYWQRCKLVTENNIDWLRKALYAIGRQDLCQHISEYNCALQLILNKKQQPHQDVISTHPVSEDTLSFISTPEQCHEDLTLQCDGKPEDVKKLLHQKDVQIDRQKEEIASLKAALRQSKQQYKQLEHQNHSLLLHNHELTLQVTEQSRQLNIATLTRSASKNGIFLTTPV